MSDSIVIGLGMTLGDAEHDCNASKRHAKWSDEDPEEWDQSTEAGSLLSDGKCFSATSDGDSSEDLPLVPSMPPGAHLLCSALPPMSPPGVHMASEQEAKTTLRLLNLPSHMSRDDILEWLSQQGFQPGLHFDFLYTQADLDGRTDVAQTLINLCSPALAEAMLRQLQGFHDWPCGNVLEVLWNNEHGQTRLVARFRNSPVMHRSVADICRPVLFSRHGLQVEFPKLTRRVRKPLAAR